MSTAPLPVSSVGNLHYNHKQVTFMSKPNELLNPSSAVFSPQSTNSQYVNSNISTLPVSDISPINERTHQFPNYYVTNPSITTNSMNNASHVNVFVPNSMSQGYDSFPIYPKSYASPYSYSTPENTCSKPVTYANNPLPSTIDFTTPNYNGNPLSSVLDHTVGSSYDVATMHLIKQGLYVKDILPFDGSPHLFGGWVSKLQNKVTGLRLTPSEVLNVMIAHTTSEPKKFLTELSAGTGAITQDVLNGIYNEFKLKFGSNAKVAENLIQELDKLSLPRYRSPEHFDKLHNMSRRIEFNKISCPELYVFDTSFGVQKFLDKLPDDSRKRWNIKKVAYKERFDGAHPPFSMFSEFLRFETSFQHEYQPSKFEKTDKETKTKAVKSLKTNDGVKKSHEDESNCILHDNSKHETAICKEFSKLSHQEKVNVAKKKKKCFRCLANYHFVRPCDKSVKCDSCGGRHVTIMHNPDWSPKTKSTHEKDKGESPKDTEKSADDTHSDDAGMSSSNKVLKTTSGRSCSRTGLVDLFLRANPHHRLRGYAIIDDQCEDCLITQEAADFFEKEFPVADYSFDTVNGLCTVTNGRLVTGLVVQGIDDRKKQLQLPTAKVNLYIPECRDEVASPEQVRSIPHVSEYAENFNDLDENAKTIMIIGRNCGDVLNLKVFGRHAPFVYKTPLFYSLVGETCSVDTKQNRKVLKTVPLTHEHFRTKNVFSTPETNLSTDNNLFMTSTDDELIGYSTDDRKFLNIMETEVVITPDGSLQAPLPLKDENLPSNGSAVYQRTKNMFNRMKVSQPETFKQCIDIVQKYIDRGEVEIVPHDEIQAKLKYHLPLFVVKHPKKNKVRLVFDAKATYQGSSLNDHVLSGPDLTNELRGVLLRFREHAVAVVADIEGMFHAFKMAPEHKDTMRFFWPKDPNADVLEYIELRPTTHIFGVCSSPAIANFCLKKIGRDAETISEESKTFIERCFYVDDGLSSYETEEVAIRTLTEVRRALKEKNVHLHEIISNSSKVLDAFPDDELSKACYTLDQPMRQRTLGVMWNAKSDCFSIEVTQMERPFTKRGILATINGIYDPEGYVAPVVLEGRLFQREVLPPKEHLTHDMESLGWDDLLPSSLASRWIAWVKSLQDLASVAIPRCFVPYTSEWEQEIHAFSDASDHAIGWVLYMRSINPDGDIHVSFIVACSKVAPRAAGTIPRLELCAADGASQCTAKVVSELRNKPSRVKFYTDSKIVLGYIQNKTKRFKRYVERRVSTILSTTSPEQWFYVSTDVNPADLACRPQKPKELAKSRWLKGPEMLWSTTIASTDEESAEIDLPEEVTKTVVLATTSAHEEINQLCVRVGTLYKTVGVAQILLKMMSKLDAARQKVGVCLAIRDPNPSRASAEAFLVEQSQRESFPDDYKWLASGKELPGNNKMSKLSPFVTQGIIKVGGRLQESTLPSDVKHPALLPRSHPLTRLKVMSVHAQIHHQGRHLTLGALRQKGLHVQNSKSVLKKTLSSCVICKRLRGTLCHQKMANLPGDRVEEVAPFTYSGVDLFGPFAVHDGKTTRRTNATKTEHVVIFACLMSRAVHLEPCPNLDTSSFRNALDRFLSIRGTCMKLRSDNGSNLVCTSKQIATLDLQAVQENLAVKGISWEFNPPGASHFGGHYERKIGAIRRILEGACVQHSKHELSRDEFHTLLQQSASIVNNTPLWEVSASPDEPAPLTPAALLTLKEAPADINVDQFTERDLIAYGTRRWRRVQYMADRFWDKWKLFYLQELQLRNKWTKTARQVQKGDVVILREKNSPRNSWPLGLVDEVKVSKDGLVRSAFVMLGKGTKRRVLRAVTDMVILISVEREP